MTRDTSLKAYINEVAPTLNARQIAVLEVFERKSRDLTNAELGVSLEWSINRVTPRVLELREAGILEESRRRRCEVTGREVHAWQVKAHPVSAPRTVCAPPARYQLSSMSERQRTHKLKVLQGIATCDCKGYLFRGRCSHIEVLKNRKPGPEETMTSLFETKPE